MNKSSIYKIVSARHFLLVILISVTSWLVSVFYDIYAQKYKDEFYSEFPKYSKIIRNHSNFQTWVEKRFNTLTKHWKEIIKSNRSYHHARFRPYVLKSNNYKLWVGVFYQDSNSKYYKANLLQLKNTSTSQKLFIKSVMELLANFRNYTPNERYDKSKNLENRLKCIFGEGFQILAFRAKYASKAIPVFFQGYEGYLLWQIFFKDKKPHSFIVLFHEKPQNSYILAIKLLYKQWEKFSNKLALIPAFFRYPVTANKPASIVVRHRKLNDSYALDALRRISEKVVITQIGNKNKKLGYTNFPVVNLALYDSNKKWQWMMLPLDPKSGMFAAIFKRIELPNKKNVILLVVISILIFYIAFTYFVEKYFYPLKNIKTIFGTWFLSLSIVPLVLIFASGFVILDINYSMWKENRLQELEDEFKNLESIKLVLLKEIETKLYNLLEENFELKKTVYEINYRSANPNLLDVLVENLVKKVGINLVGFGIYGHYEFGYTKWYKKLSKNHLDFISHEFYLISSKWLEATNQKLPPPLVKSYPEVRTQKSIFASTRTDERYSELKLYKTSSLVFAENETSFYIHMLNIKGIPGYLLFIVFEYDSMLKELINKKIQDHFTSNHLYKLGYRVKSKFYKDQYFPNENWVKRVTNLSEDANIVTEVSQNYGNYIVYSRPSVALRDYIICGYTNIKDLIALKSSFIKLFVIMVLFIIIYLWLIAHELANNLTHPMRTMIKALNEVREGNLEVSVYDGRTDELGNAMCALEKMIEELKTKRTLTKFIPPQVLASVTGGKLERILGSRLPNVSILTSDIRNFTTLCEKYRSEQIFTLLNEHIKLMTSAIQDNGGTVVRFIGDAVVAMFESDEKANSSLKSVNAAIKINEYHRNYVNKRINEGLFGYNIGIGISTGDVITGILGNEEVRLDYSVLGDIVIKSASLEGYSKYSDVSNIVLDENTRLNIINNHPDLSSSFVRLCNIEKKLKSIDDKNEDIWQLDEIEFINKSNNQSFNFNGLSKDTISLYKNELSFSKSYNKTLGSDNFFSKEKFSFKNDPKSSWYCLRISISKIFILIIPVLLILLEAYSYKKINNLTAIYNSTKQLNEILDDIAYKLNVENYIYDKILNLIHKRCYYKNNDIKSLVSQLEHITKFFENIRFSIHKVNSGKILYTNQNLKNESEFNFILAQIREILALELLGTIYNPDTFVTKKLLSCKTYKISHFSSKDLYNKLKSALLGFTDLDYDSQHVKFMAIPLFTYDEVIANNKKIFSLNNFINYAEYNCLLNSIRNALDCWLICWYFENKNSKSNFTIVTQNENDFCKKVLYDAANYKDVSFALVKNGKVVYNTDNFDITKIPHIILQDNNLSKVTSYNYLYVVGTYLNCGKIILSKYLVDYYTRFITKKEIGFFVVWFFVWYFVFLNNKSKLKEMLVVQLTLYFFVATVPILYITFVFVSKSKLSLINKDYKKINQEIIQSNAIYEKALEIDLAWINRINSHYIRNVFRQIVSWGNSLEAKQKDRFFKNVQQTKIVDVGHKNTFCLLFLGNGEIYFHMNQNNPETINKYKRFAIYLLSKIVPKLASIPNNLYEGWQVKEAEKVIIGSQFEEFVSLLSQIFGEEYLLFNLSSLHFLGYWLTNNIRREFANWNLLLALPKAVGYYIALWPGPYRISKMQYYLFKNRLFLANNYAIGYRIFNFDSTFTQDINKEIIVISNDELGEKSDNYRAMNLKALNNYFYELLLRKARFFQKSLTKQSYSPHNKSILLTNCVPKLENKILCYRIPLSKIENNVFAIVKIQELFLIILILNVVLVSLKSSNELLKALLDLTQCTIEVIKGNFNVSMNINYYGEFKDLAISFNKMALAGREGKLLGKFVSPAVRKIAADKISEEEAKRGLAKKTLVLYIGLSKFTEKIKNFPPEIVINDLNEYLKILSLIIRENNGEIDKFIGEKVLVVFNESSFDSCMKACYEIYNQVKLKYRFKLGIPAFGISFGEVLAGLMGSDIQRLEYTIIGDTVNLAARLCSVADNMKGGVVIEYKAFSKFEDKIPKSLKNKFNFVRLGEVKIKGKEQIVDVIYALPT